MKLDMNISINQFIDMQNISKKVVTGEVIRSFLAADQAKGIDKTWRAGRAEQQRMYFKKAVKFLSRCSENDLEKLVRDKHRLKRFLGHRWFLRRVALKHVGGCPHIGDISRKWCQGSVVDVANQITLHSNIEKESLKKISSMITIIDDILEFFPPVLVQGGEIRENLHFLSLPFDADDGSHRCVAAALSGKKFINAYVGVM